MNKEKTDWEPHHDDLKEQVIRRTCLTSKSLFVCPQEIQIKRRSSVDVKEEDPIRVGIEQALCVDQHDYERHHLLLMTVSMRDRQLK